MTLPVNTAKNQMKALRSMYALNRRMSWLHAIQGIDISRCFEYLEAFGIVTSVHGEGQVLDVGSYRSPFPVFLAYQGYDVSVVDLNPTVAKQREWARRAIGEGVSPSVYMADGMRLPFSDAVFDVVTCISTVEHLDHDGDMRLVSEVGRVLRTKGRCFISVPYSLPPREGTWGRWFQRWYDVPTSLARLVEPSGLSLVNHGFLMGGKVGRFADFWYAFPRLFRHALSWLHIFLYPAIRGLDEPDSSDARVLWLSLEKIR